MTNAEINSITQYFKTQATDIMAVWVECNRNANNTFIDLSSHVVPI